MLYEISIEDPNARGDEPAFTSLVVEAPKYRVVRGQTVLPSALTDYAWCAGHDWAVMRSRNITVAIAEFAPIKFGATGITRTSTTCTITEMVVRPATRQRYARGAAGGVC